MRKKFIIIEKKNVVAKIHLDEIIYIEQYRRETTIVTIDKSFKYNCILKDLYGQTDKRFCRCHRSYIVNFDYVQYIDNECVCLSCNKKIAMCKANLQKAKKIYMEYLKKYRKKKY